MENVDETKLNVVLYRNNVTYKKDIERVKQLRSTTMKLPIVHPRFKENLDKLRFGHLVFGGSLCSKDVLKTFRIIFLVLHAT